MIVFLARQWKNSELYVDGSFQECHIVYALFNLKFYDLKRHEKFRSLRAVNVMAHLPSPTGHELETVHACMHSLGWNAKHEL